LFASNRREGMLSPDLVLVLPLVVVSLMVALA
jgi:hypothetical protein